MGFEQEMRIEAPLEKVAAVLDRVEDYARLFPGFASVKLAKQKGARWWIDWEQRIPIPLLAEP